MGSLTIYKHLTQKIMNENSQTSRKDGRAQPRIEEPDEENLNYSEMRGGRGGSPTGAYPDKDSPQDLDHPDISEENPVGGSREDEFPMERNSPGKTEIDPRRQDEGIRRNQDDFQMNQGADRTGDRSLRDYDGPDQRSDQNESNDDRNQRNPARDNQNQESREDDREHRSERNR